MLNFQEADNAADELMKQVFGNVMNDNSSTMLMFSMSQDIPNVLTSKEIRVEEISESESDSESEPERESESGSKSESDSKPELVSIPKFQLDFQIDLLQT